MMRNVLFPIIAIIILVNYSNGINQEEAVKKFFSRGNHTDIWAVLIDGHSPQLHEQSGSSAIMVMYQMLKKFGVTDDRIIVMMGNLQQCSPINPSPGKVLGFLRENEFFDVNNGVEIDYRGSDVTVLNVLRVLTDRHPPATLRSKRLLSHGRSNVLVMFANHGSSSGTLSFANEDESLNAFQLANAIRDMYLQNRYNEMLVIAISCHAGEMCRRLSKIENVLCFGSSSPKELTTVHVSQTYYESTMVRYSSYKFLAHLIQLLDDTTKNKYYSIEDFVSSCTREKCYREMFARRDLYPRKLNNVSLTNFFKPQPHIEYLPKMEIPDSDFD